MNPLTLINPRHYVAHWNEARLNRVADSQNSFAAMYLDYLEDTRVAASQGVDVKPIHERIMKHAWDEYQELAPAKRRAAFAPTMATTGENLEPLREWVEALTGSRDELTISVMAHWCWLVKRKLFGLPVVHHLMPILFGPQGSGKSSAVNLLIAPWHDFTFKMALTSLSSPQVYPSLEHNFVTFFDELQGVERTDLNTLKNMVTTDRLTYRKLYSHEMYTRNMNCSFIGATNKNINESLFDSTGMRRFFEITTSKLVNRGLVNDIDYKALWLGIDESRPRGYIEDQLEQLSKAQERYVMKEPFDEYVDEKELRTPGTKFKSICSRSLYLNYTHWCIENGIKPLHSIAFGRKMSNAGFAHFEKRDDKGSRVRHYKVNPAAALPELASEPTESTILKLEST